MKMLFDFTDMFQKAIMQSGFSFNTWALIKHHRDIAVRLSKKLGCQSDDTLAILQYLKTVPAKDLVRHSKFEVSLLKKIIKQM